MSTGRFHWHRFCHRRQEYLNSCFTWCYQDYKDKTKAAPLVESVLRLWQGKRILLVEGIHAKSGVNNSLYSNALSIRRILCPAQNAFDHYEDILQMIVSSVKDEDLVLLSLGPTAKILAYDLHTLYGIRSIDLGHFDTGYKMYVKDSGIKGRIMTEAEYNNQIVGIIHD